MPGGDRVLELLGQPLAVVELTGLARRRADRPRTAALPMIDGGKIRPRATPPTTPHFRPCRVLWSVAFWTSSVPSARA